MGQKMSEILEIPTQRRAKIHEKANYSLSVVEIWRQIGHSISSCCHNPILHSLFSDSINSIACRTFLISTRRWIEITQSENYGSSPTSYTQPYIN